METDETTDWYEFGGFRHCGRCRSRRCERQVANGSPCAITCPRCDATRLSEEDNVSGKKILRCANCRHPADTRRTDAREQAEQLLESILAERLEWDSDWGIDGREKALGLIERYHPKRW